MGTKPDRYEMMLKRLAKHRDPFTGGALLALTCTSLWQDWMGKEEYLLYIEDYWIDASIGVPLALVSLVLALWLARG